ncbi:MAG: alpha/beta hydrolase [Gemmataceae bacterium]
MQVLRVVIVALLLVMTASATRGAEPALSPKVIPNVSYFEGSGADKVRHKLDIYVPAGVKNFPVVFFVHGGAWRIGDKDHYRIYSKFADSLAKSGIGMVSTNYRLFPKVKHPDQIKDVAKAFAWTFRNIKKYGGDPNAIFVCGHSAGGHLVALLATDEKYLKRHKLSHKCICGAIPVSGVYTILNQPTFTQVFGKSEKMRKSGSPINFVSKTVPPFLIMHAEYELPGCTPPLARAFYNALNKVGATATLYEAKRQNHVTIMLGMRNQRNTVHQKILEFIRTQTRTQAASKEVQTAEANR